MPSLPVAAAGIVAVLVIVAAGIFLVGQEGLPAHAPPEPGASAHRNWPDEGISAPTMTPAPTPALPSAVPPEPVSFALRTGTPVSCGLTCRETETTVTNTGDITAHSVCVTLEVFNERGARIFVNSRPSIER
ncbi:MAG: hypothetical protein QHG99_02115 [Methanomicrobiales archaeon]|nr:hypothetical protein [Methanomicrobiales archaeon]